MILRENELFAQFVLHSGLKIYFFWQKYTSQTKYFFGSLGNRSSLFRGFYTHYWSEIRGLPISAATSLKFTAGAPVVVAALV